MVEPRPTKVPEWNTGGSNRTEPTSGEKVTGWALDDQPPSSYFNWLQYYAGAAIEWLYERMNDGANEEDLTIAALQPDSSGDGGDLLLTSGTPNTSGNAGRIELRSGLGGTIGDGGEIQLNAGGSVNDAGGAVEINAGDSTNDQGGAVEINAGDSTGTDGGAVDINAGDASGTDQNGGGITLDAGDGTGTGFSRVTVNCATAGAGSGSGVNSAETYIQANGEFENVAIKKYLVAQNTAAVDPTRGNMRLQPRVQPTTPAAGDVYYDSSTKQVGVYTGARYQNMNPNVYSNSDQAYKGRAITDTANRYYGFEAATYGGTLQNVPLRYTIQANSLRVGSIIRVRATLEFISGTGDPPNPCILFGSVLTGTGPYLVGTAPLVAPNVAIFEQDRSGPIAWDTYAMECDIRVRVIGASGRLDYGGWGIPSFNTPAVTATGVTETLGDTSNYPTNGNLDVYPGIFTNASTNTIVECLKFIVDVI